jgi:hypothetical protein
MRRLNLLLVVAVALWGAPAWADDEPTKAGADFKPHEVRKTGMRYRGDLDALVKGLKLPPDQADKMLASLKKQRADQEALEKDNAARVKELDEKNKDLADQQNDLRKKNEAMKADQKKLKQPGEVEGQSIVKDQQLRDWESFKLTRNVTRQYQRAKLTDKQVEDIRSMSDSEAKTLASASPEEYDKIDRQTRQRLAAKVDKILTSDQKESVEVGHVQDSTVKSMQGVNLTTDQYDKINAKCAEAVKTWRRNSGDKADAEKQWNEFRAQRDTFAAQVTKDIHDNILTPEQRAMIDAPKPKDAAKEAASGAPSAAPSAAP